MRLQFLGVQTIGVHILGGILKKFVNIYGKKTKGPQTRQNKENKTGLQPVSRPVERILGFFPKGFKNGSVVCACFFFT